MVLLIVVVLMVLFVLVLGLLFILFIFGVLVLGGIVYWIKFCLELESVELEVFVEVILKSVVIGDVLDFDDIYVEFVLDLVEMVFDFVMGLDVCIINMC